LIKERLSKNQFTIGSWITLAHTAIAEIMCQAGFDWLTIDMEHSVIELAQAQELIRTIESYGVTPLVRIGENNPTIIKRVMDAGATGIIVPMVNSRADAERAIESVHYPPSGKRGVGLARAQKYGLGFEEYKLWLAKESIIVVQIEHIKAIENLGEILSVSGIDASIIGPYDLSGSLGCPGEFGNERVVEAIQEYEKVCYNLGKPMGFHLVEPNTERAHELQEQGYNFLAVGLDTLFLGLKCRDIVGVLKG
jgi:2-dehydro-3-deoxyglucarate aldolase